MTTGCWTRPTPSWCRARRPTASSRSDRRRPPARPTTTTSTADATDSMTVSGPVRFSVGFPKPPAVQPQPTPPWVGEPAPATGLPGAGGGSPAGGSSHPRGACSCSPLRSSWCSYCDATGARAAPEPKDEEHPVPVTYAAGPVPSPLERRTGPLCGSSSSDRSGSRRSRARPPSSRAACSATSPSTTTGRARSTTPRPHCGRRRLTETDVSRKTFLNHVSEVRRAVGSEHFPDNAKRSGYRLRERHDGLARVPRARRRRPLASAAPRAVVDPRRGTPAGPRRPLRVRGLEVVPVGRQRGTPHRDHQGRSSRSRSSPHRARARRRPRGRGVRASPGAARRAPTELSLWSCLADVVQARGDPGDLERFWRDVEGGPRLRLRSTLLEARVHG